MGWWLKGLSCIRSTSWNFQQYHGKSTYPLPADGSAFRQLDWYFNLLMRLFSKYSCGPLHGKKDRNSITNKGHIFPFSSFCHLTLQPQELSSCRGLPARPKIAEVGERLWSSTQTGWRAQPRCRFSEGKVLQLRQHLRNLPRSLIVCKSQEYSSWIILLLELRPAGSLFTAGAVNTRMRMATHQPWTGDTLFPHSLPLLSMSEIVCQLL